jgi:hypothetical protein
MKRLACQIAAQLPESQDEALLVLSYAREIILNLGGGGWERQDAAELIQLCEPPEPIGRAVSGEGATVIPIGRLGRANPE